MRLPNLIASTECWDTLPPFCRRHPGQPHAKARSGMTRTKGQWPGNRWGQFTPCFSMENYHFPADTVSKNATGLLPGKSHTHHWSLLGILEVGPKGVLSKGE